jgi:predicted dehydrogenase
MAKIIKWGVIGSGGIARRRTIPEGIVSSENSALTALYDINSQVNAEVAAKFDAKAVGSIAELLKSDIDAVYIATPANFHSQQVLACAQAGKNILCEKPLAMTVEETKEMIKACKSANVILATAFMMRFNSHHQAALDMIERGKLGKPTYARAQLSCWYPPIQGAWRQVPEQGGGGSLIDMGGHCIDLLEMFFGNVVRVSCFTKNTVHDYISEDSAVAMLMFENGAIGTVDTFFCIPDNSCKNVLELYGSTGSILAQGTIGQTDGGQMTAYLEESGKSYDAQQAETVSESLSIKPEPVNMYHGEIEELNRAIVENRQPINNAQIGLRSQKILAACYESAKTSKSIQVS